MFRSLALLTLLAAVSCNQLGNNPSTIDRALLAQVSDSEMERVSEERATLFAARDELARAKSEYARMELALELAKDEHDLAEERIDAKRSAVELVKEPGGRSDLERVRTELERAEANQRYVAARVALRENELARSERGVELAEAKVELAQAQVEEAKAHAVASLDRVDVRDIDVKPYGECTRDCQTAVDVAQLKLDAAKEEVEIYKKRYDAAGKESR